MAATKRKGITTEHTETTEEKVESFLSSSVPDSFILYDILGNGPFVVPKFFVLYFAFSVTSVASVVK